MFESEMRDVIAEGEEEMVVAIMARAKQLARFGNQVGHRLLVFGLMFKASSLSATRSSSW